jgi:drug/metabolite transporter (DMT)-like permease
MSTDTAAPRARLIALAAVLDVAVVVAFAAIGRASHDENVLTGLGVTAWPFLVALCVGWAALLAWRRPTAPVRTGVGVWLITVAGGMLLRAVTGQGVAIAFIVVATVVLLVLLVGWRAIATLVRRHR